MRRRASERPLRPWSFAALCVGLCVGLCVACSAEQTPPQAPLTPLEATLEVPRAVWSGQSLTMQVSLSAPADVQWDLVTDKSSPSRPPKPKKGLTSGLSLALTSSRRERFTPKRRLHRPRRRPLRPVEVLKPGIFQPTRSGTVATRGGLAVALCRDADLLTVVRRQGESWAIDRRITTCDSPRTLALAPGPTPTHVAVCCEGDDQLQVLDLNSGQEVASYSFPWGAHPYGVLWRKDGLFVTLRARGQVAQLELNDAELSLTRQVTATDDARGVASLPDGDLLITRWRSPADRGVVVRLRPDTGDVTEIALPWADLAPSDGESGGVPSYLDQALIVPQGDVAWLPGLHANNRDGLWRNGAPLTHETSTRAMLARLLINSNGSIEEASDQRLLFEDRGLLQAGAISPLGDWLFLVDHGARTVERIDLARGGVLSGVILGVGYGPQGLAVSDDGEWLLVDAQLSRELVIYRLSDRGPLPQTPTVRLGLVEQEPLSPEALRGKQLFNDSFDTRLADDSYIACAHCHLDGESDGRVGLQRSR